MSSLSIFRNNSFRQFFYATLIGLFGEGIFALTALVLITKETASVMAIGYMMVITMLPSVILAPVSGVIIDRLNKAKIAIWCNISRFVLIGIVPVTIWLDLFTIEILYLSLFLNYISWYLLVPTSESMLKEVLNEEEYVQGVSFSQAAWQVGLLSSALLAGLLMKYVGTPETLMVAALTYLVGGLLFVRISRLYQANKKSAATSQAALPTGGGAVRSYLQDMKEGWGYLFRNKAVLWFSLGACITAPFFSGINILIAPFNYDILNGSELTLGVIDSAAGLGSLISAGICLYLANKKGIPLYLIGSLAFLALSTVLFSLSTGVVMATVLYVFLGIFIGNVKVFSKSLVYKYVDDAYIGRTMTTISMLSLSLAILYSLVIGFLGESSIVAAYEVIALSLIVPVVFTVLGRRAVQRQNGLAGLKENPNGSVNLS